MVNSLVFSLLFSSSFLSTISYAERGAPLVPERMNVGETLVLKRSDSLSVRTFFSPLWQDVCAHYHGKEIQLTCSYTSSFLGIFVEDSCTLKLDYPGVVELSWWERAGFSFEKMTARMLVL